MKHPPSRKYQILSYLKGKKNASSQEVARKFGISRQMSVRHLTDLVNMDLIQKKGSTKSAEYTLSDSSLPKHKQQLKLIKDLKGLEEDKVFEEVQRILHLKKVLSTNTNSIAYYAFSEMLNNAIDHSKSKSAKILIDMSKGIFYFSIYDQGIGIFKNVADNFELKSELEGLEHLLKGKQTTMPECHSGQGIFFTSRIADQFRIRSHQIELIVDNKKNDYFVGECKKTKGTLIEFWIRAKTRKSLEALFRNYANEDFEFDRSDIHVKLSQFEGLLSRSQARRIAVGLEKFDSIIFDFKDVKFVGQAFTDEIFRVYQRRHPALKLAYINAVPVVEMMILRALKSE